MSGIRWWTERLLKANGGRGAADPTWNAGSNSTLVCTKCIRGESWGFALRDAAREAKPWNGAVVTGRQHTQTDGVAGSSRLRVPPREANCSASSVWGSSLPGNTPKKTDCRVVLIFRVLAQQKYRAGSGVVPFKGLTKED